MKNVRCPTGKWSEQPLFCQHCNKEFTSPANSANNKPKYCSKSCAVSVRNSNRQWSEKSRGKAASAKKGIYIGDKNPNYKGAFTLFICKQCNNEFKVENYNLRGGKHSGIFCSVMCKRAFVTKNKMTDSEKKLYLIFGRNISKAVKQGKNRTKWTELVGYSLNELRTHLETLFQPGMNWDNYGRYGWHIDHIKPASYFSYETPFEKEFQECWALQNLQPMWAKENLAKGGNNRKVNIKKYGEFNRAQLPKSTEFN